jgi:hypothetical protein
MTKRQHSRCLHGTATIVVASSKTDAISLLHFFGKQTFIFFLLI